ncbi:MAG TPA: hypothetical protein PKC60_03940 [Hydrogenophaga sp.]|uniref:hypothetical protein n=1 Tax=Hydrogenophaga sp. TaxID=1904254 RepID=UPI002C56AAF9|nr:hypothetical protein [Hydrogenophaga sp.]HMN92362.1 hypothetical protein [Hydrogenophaga sp.]HMP10588.1 hypothetical protein [Hydrogenophaga sp.]
MPWQRPHRTQVPPSPAPVPDTETVRLAALSASWRRDRTVARRRLLWRWLAWIFIRYHLILFALPALVLASLWLWRGLQPAEGHPLLPSATNHPASGEPIGLVLKSSDRIGTPNRPDTMPSQDRPTDPFTPPPSIPENGLHSKEP